MLKLNFKIHYSAFDVRYSTKRLLVPAYFKIGQAAAHMYVYFIFCCCEAGGFVIVVAGFAGHSPTWDGPAGPEHYARVVAG